ncbi:MAG: hypothetical protein ACHQC8_06515 [Solirubrobacterales bacterium]
MAGSSDSARKDVFTVIDKGEGKKAYWCKVGSAWENQDGSWNILLDALPVNGKLNMRDPYEAPEGGQGSQGQGGGRDDKRGSGYQRGGGRR